MYGFSIVTRAASTRRPNTRLGSRRGTGRESRGRGCRRKVPENRRARPSPLLPDRGYTPRVTATNHRVQRTHVYPEFQGVRRHDAEQVTRNNRVSISRRSRMV